MACKECGGMKFSYNVTLGERECSNCGLIVIEELYEKTTSSLTTSYDNYGNLNDAYKENDDKVGGLGSTIGIKSPGIPNRKLIRQLRRTERNHKKTNRERSIQKGITFCMMVASEYPITQRIRDQVSRNYLTLVNGHNLNGFTYEDRAGAIVFFTLKDNGIRTNIGEIASFAEGDANRIHKLARKIARIFCKPWVLSQVNPISDLEKFCQDLGEEFDFAKDCFSVYAALSIMIDNHNWQIGIPLLSTVIYITSVLTDSKVTQQKIAETLGTTTVTIRMHLNRICDVIGMKKEMLKVLTLDEFVSGVIR